MTRSRFIPRSAQGKNDIFQEVLLGLGDPGVMPRLEELVLEDMNIRTWKGDGRQKRASSSKVNEENMDKGEARNFTEQLYDALVRRGIGGPGSERVEKLVFWNGLGLQSLNLGILEKVVKVEMIKTMRWDDDLVQDL